MSAARTLFQPGDAVKWATFRGRIVRRLDDLYTLVRDNTGLPPRIVRSDRLERDYSLAFEPRDAA